MNFNDFLNEKNFQVVTSGEVINYRLSYQYGKGGFVAMASSGKELDKQIEIDDPDTIGKAIEDSINDELKKRRQLFTVEQDHGYQGAGYSFYFNMDGLIKLLNK
jgi:predicted heme/steroid binding protein